MTRMLSRSCVKLAPAAAALVLHATPALAVTRVCGANGVSNTANVLCAAPSGPCTGSSVRLTAPLDVTAGGCVFDLGGRTLSVERRFDMIGTGFIAIVNAGAVSITSQGRLQARGDYVKSGGVIVTGGKISINSSGAITNDGVLDVSGDAAGRVELIAAGNVSLTSGSTVRGIGISTWADDRGRFADGGRLKIVSQAGSVAVDGAIVMSSQSEAEGGSVVFQAARNIDVRYTIDASGGVENGGGVDLTAGDNITITRVIDVDSRGGGGSGGDISLAAGEDSLGGVVVGGTLHLDDGTLNLSGSSGDSVGGDGGTLTAEAQGGVVVAAVVTMRANAGTSYDGDGGEIRFSSADEDPSTVGALDGDLTLAGPILARSGNIGGGGGLVVVRAGRNLSVSGNADLGGRDFGGEYLIDAARAASLWADIDADATNAGGAGGQIHAQACQLSLMSTANLDTSGGDGIVWLSGSNQISAASASHVRAVGPGGSVTLVTRATSPTNPDTGGTLGQFDPAPNVVADPLLPPCP